MNEYRIKLGINSETTSQNDSINESGNIPGFMSLAEVYGLEDDMTIGSGHQQQVQSVDQEYSEYVSAVLSPSTVDILKFWEVCTAFSLIIGVLTHAFLDQRHILPYFVCYRNGLHSDPGISCTMREGILL